MPGMSSDVRRRIFKPSTNFINTRHKNRNTKCLVKRLGLKIDLKNPSETFSKRLGVPVLELQVYFIFKENT
jgi:hypothetical protein